MATVSFRYGGARGKRLRLVDANEWMVVRTASRDALERTPLGLDAQRAIEGWRSVARFEEAGVEVLEAPEGSRRTARRNAARAALKEQREIEFAGRVLCRPGSRDPAIYTENLFVKLHLRTNTRARMRLFRSHGLRVKRELESSQNAYFLGAPEGCGRAVFDIAAALLAEDDVLLCHPEVVGPIRRRAAFPQQWHLQDAEIGGQRIRQHAHVVEAWPLSEGEGATIAVIDDGFDVDHVEFAGAGKVIWPRDVTRDRDDARPQFASNNHGTACAGVACANGAHGASGVAPRAKLMPIRMASALGSQQEADAIMWAAQHGADVISCSWGPTDGKFGDPEDPAHDVVHPLPDSTREAIEFAVTQGRRGRGCVIAWAAGNGNESVDNDHYAACDKLIAVGASDDRGKRAPYSDYGKAIWCVFPSDHKLPSFTPGIWTTDRRAGAGFNPGRTQVGDAAGLYTSRFGGTSSACPGAAGVAALVLARNPALRWEQVREILARCCDKIDAAEREYDETGRSPQYGHGRLNARRAVELAGEAKPPHTIHRVVRDVPIRDHETSTLTLSVPPCDPLRELRVDVDIEHTWPGDLLVRVHPPQQLGIDPLVLWDGEGGSVSNIRRVFDRLSNPSLASVEGLDPSGSWTLEVTDRAARDQGRIVHFGLELFV